MNFSCRRFLLINKDIKIEPTQETLLDLRSNNFAIQYKQHILKTEKSKRRYRKRFLAKLLLGTNIKKSYVQHHNNEHWSQLLHTYSFK